jgi:transposase
MGKPHPLALRERVIGLVEEGNTHRSVAAHFRVSIKFVNDMVLLKRRTGSLEPKAQGHGGWSKLGAFDGWVRSRLASKGDLRLDELVQELREQHGVQVARSSVGYWLHRLGLSHKKNAAAK